MAKTSARPASIIADFLSLIIGLTSSLTIRLVGDLPIAEILVIFLLPALLVFRGSRLLLPRFGIILVLLALWLANQIATDVYRGTEAIDWMRGDANIVFFAIDLIVLAALIAGNSRRQVLLAAGFAVGSLAAARFEPSVFALQEPWKFGYATGANILAALVSCFFFARGRRWIAGSIFVAIMAVNLMENYRSPVLNILVAFVLVLFPIPEHLGRVRILPRAGTVAHVLVLVIFTAVAAAGAAGLVRLATSRGLISEDARLKNQAQSQAFGGLLIGGRPEILVSSRAAMDAPILGHGSWAKDFKYTEMLNDLQTQMGFQTDLEDIEEQGQGSIPTHSHLMGAWVQAGIFGAIFWVYIFWIALKGLLRVSVLRPPLAPFYATMLAGLFWDIGFSPFASTRRLTESLMIVIIVNLLATAPLTERSWDSSRFRVWQRHRFVQEREPSPMRPSV